MPSLKEIDVVLFSREESPYFGMFRAGCLGIPIEECVAECSRLGIPVRSKDVEAWKDGKWKHDMNHRSSVLNPAMPKVSTSEALITKPKEYRLESFPLFPDGWNGTDVRWFPTDENNRPMQKWGYSDGFRPTLYTKANAQALSPVGWVGQNMFMQPFIVIDIDGVGHGGMDTQVIEFGRKYSGYTETWEDPMKPGSFHLYFSTNRMIPIRHYPYAKLDLMGNEKNAAVYMKNKQWNGIDRKPLTSEIFEDLKAYLKMRFDQRKEQ